MATEKRLIDANACPCVKCDRLGSCRPGLCEAFTEWWLSPVDAVEVIYCEDCKYRVLDTVSGEDWCKHTLGLCSEVYATDFCCHGERKDND